MVTSILRRLLLFVPALSLTGCTWLPYAARNTSNAFANVAHEYRFQCEIRKLADTAWSEISGATHHGLGKGGEFENGFRGGFMDFLERNGKGNPPAMPPAYLRSVVLRSAKQSQDIEDWKAGWRLGAEVASQSGWRERIVIPISLPPMPNTGGYRQEIIPPFGISPRDTGVPGVATFETTDVEAEGEVGIMGKLEESP